MHKKRVLVTIGSIVGGIAALYLFGVGLFWGRFPLYTTVNGKSVALLSPDEVTVDLMSDTRNTMVRLSGKNGSFEDIKFKDLGVYKASDMAMEDVKLNPWIWFTSIWEHHDYQLSDELSYNRENLANSLNKLVLVNGTHVKNPSDAYVYNDGSSFELIQMNDGTKIDTDRLFQVLCQHLNDWDLRIDLLKEDCYVKSGENDSSDDIEAEMQDIEKLKSLEINLVLDDSHTEVIPASILELASYQKDGKVMIRQSILSTYVDALAEKYNTRGMTRTFVTSGNKSLALTPQTSNTFLGYEMNKSALLSSIVNAISSGKSVPITVPWNSLGGELLNKQSDIGNTYLEVSIEDQHLWFYKDGQLIKDTDVVTGLDTDERRTPTGLFYVMSLNTNYTMYYSDGSAPCRYFIKVTADGVGIHDASRSTFGGELYKSIGSHGCINVPYDAEKVIFESLSANTNHNIPVVIY